MCIHRIYRYFNAVDADIIRRLDETIPIVHIHILFALLYTIMIVFEMDVL